MKRMMAMFTLQVLCALPAYALPSCFMAKENGKMLVQEGECTKRHSPCSTFKIPLALMGYDSGILVDSHNPTWDFKEEYKKNLSIMLDFWNQPHDPTLWQKNSAVWYSQVLTQKLGIKKFAAYVHAFNYGNQDISGERGKQNGLVHSWLSSSLKISPVEQLAFLEKLLDNTLPVSEQAQETTKQILTVEPLNDGWEMHGKTGSGNQLNTDGSRNPDRQIGWYVGWIQKGARSILFVHFIQDEEKHEVMAGKRARASAKEKLNALIDTLD